MLIMDHPHAVQMNALKVVGIRSMNDSFMLSRYKVDGAIFHCWSGKYYTGSRFFV